MGAKIKKNKGNKDVKGVPKGERSPLKTFRLCSTTYFLTYKGISDSGQRITKSGLAEFFLNPSDLNANKAVLKPTKYLICEQMYDDGTPHFHALIIYPKRKQTINQNAYDYLGIHPNIQTMRNLKAAYQYMYKEDPAPYTNMDIVKQRLIARAKDSTSLYQLLEEQMLKDPFTFDLSLYLARNNLFKQVYKADFNKAIRLINLAHPAAMRSVLKNKPGIKLITPELIQQRLNADEIKQFYSHPCFSRIVTHFNELHKYPNKDKSTRAPVKTKHLLLVGPADIGKTSLTYHEANDQDPHPGLAHYYPTYYLSVGQKYYPPYKSYDYSLVNWQQFTIVSDMFPKSGYNRLLNYLDGSTSALPQKGRPPVQRQDNPKHILTSNRTLEQHINKTFKSPEALQKAHNNLPARIDCVVIPKGKSIHFLRKLLVANTTQ